MKIVVAVVVLASCAVQMVFGDNLDGLRDRIAHKGQAVQKTVDRLKRHKREFSFNLHNKLNAARTASMRKISSFVDPTSRKIQAAAKKSTAKGKDANHCFETAEAKLREYSGTGQRDIDKCHRDALNSVSQDEDHMHSTIFAGQQLVAFYDSIFPSCRTSNPQRIESCITDSLLEGARRAQAFQTTTDTVITSSSSAAKTAVKNAINCMDIPVGIVRRGASEVQLEADRCIALL